MATGWYRFGPFRVELESGLLWRGRALVPLTPKCAELLLQLIQRGSRGISKAELLARLWPDTDVLESNLTSTMSMLRKALGERAGAPRYIRTVPRRGYRFVPEGEGGEPAPAAVEAAPPGAGGTAPRAIRRERYFVGRSAELERLSAWLEEARRGRGRMVCVRGEPGIGKTWLVDALLEPLEGTAAAPLGDTAVRPLVARARCLETFGADEAYLPLLDGLGQLLTGPDAAHVRATLRARAPTWYQQFPALVGSSDDLRALRRETQGATKERLLSELVEGLSALARDRLLVLWIDDLHWADASSLEVLELLSGCCRERAWLIILTCRLAEAALPGSPLVEHGAKLAPPACEDLRLGPLSRDAVDRYVEARFGQRHELPAELPSVLLARTEGHPLFMTSLLASWIERGELVSTDGRYRLTRPLSELVVEVPRDVQSTLSRQLERLEPEQRRALAHASVEGEEFSSRVLAALLEADDATLEGWLASLADVHGLIFRLAEERMPDGSASVRYRFAHALYQKLLHDGLMGARRARLHQRAAEVLVRHYGDDAPSIAAALARHFELGGDIRQAIHHLSVAAQRAHGLFAWPEARELFTRALELVERLPAEEAAPLVADLHYARAWVDFDARAGDFGRSDFELSREHAARARDPKRECQATFAASVLAYFELRLDDSRVLDERLLELADASRIAEVRCLARISLGGGYVVEGDVETALAYNAAARALLEPGFDSNLFAMLDYDLARCRRLRSRYASALTSYEQALVNFLEQFGTRLMAMTVYQDIGNAQINLGQLSAALRSYRQAQELARFSGQGYRLRELPSRVGWALRELGRCDEAVDFDREAAAAAAQQGAGFSQASHLIDLAVSELERGEVAAAEEPLLTARGLLEAGKARAFPCEVAGVRLRLLDAECDLARARGRLDVARARAEELLEDALRLAWPKYCVLAHAQRARIARARGELAGARRELERALARLRTNPVPIVGWKLWTELADLELEAGGDARFARRQARRGVRAVARGIAEPVHRRSFLGSRAVRALLAMGRAAPRRR